MIGRPPDKSAQQFLCPQCHNKSLTKAGFRKARNRQGIKLLQAYRCKLCFYQTVKPSTIEADNG